MQHLFSIFKDNKSNSPIIKGAKAALTVETANDILINLFGQKSTNFIKAVYLKNGILGIKINSSSAASEVKMSEKLIIQKINEIYGQKSVEKINFLL